MGYKFNIFTKKFDIVEAGGGGGGDIETITGDSGGPVGPDGSHNINLLGNPDLDFVGNPGTFTIQGTNLTKITPYVVGPIGQYAYQTIQSAINAANADGGGLVFVTPGTYTENLTFFDNIYLFGSSEQATFIVGTHTPPSSGNLNINRVTFQSVTDIFFSNAVGTTSIIMEDTSVEVTNGYTFNLPNFNASASVAVFNIGNFGTNDGFFFNTGGCQFYAFAAGIGNGAANAMTISGISQFANQIAVGCPVNYVTGASFSTFGCEFLNTVTFSNNSTGSSYGDSYLTGSNPAIVMSSSGTVTVSNATIDSTNNPAIGGSGVGTFQYAGLVFVNNSTIDGTLTDSPLVWKPYSTAGDISSAVRGTSGFDTNQFTVTNGFVTLNTLGFPWIDQSGAFIASINTGYFLTAASTITLPVAPSQGDIIRFVADTTGSVVITANAGQTIRLANSTTSVAGTLTNSLRGDAIELVYRTTGSVWIAFSNPNGTWLPA